MRYQPHARMLSPTPLTLAAAAAIVATITFCLAFLLAGYSSLPGILPVHFNRLNRADGWQYKTYARVLTPVLVQATLSVVLGAIGLLLLWRSYVDEPVAVMNREPGLAGGTSEDAAASVAVEAIALFALIWVVFQAFGAMALIAMWQRGRGGLGPWYGVAMAIGVILSIIVGLRAQARLGRPSPRPFVAEHWRFGQLYKNAADPALFVPTRDGRHWTINFGRPATALMGVCLIVGMIAPTLVLDLLLR